MISFKKRKLFCAVAIAIVFLSGGTIVSYAEGSKDLFTPTTMGYRQYLNASTVSGAFNPYPNNGVHKVYAKAGEIIYAGSSIVGSTLSGATGSISIISPAGATVAASSSISTGRINNRTQELNGPARTGHAGSNYYTPLSYTVPTAGIYEVQFIGLGTGTNIPDGTPTDQYRPAANASSWVQPVNASSSALILAWDVSVGNSSGTLLPGRVYSTCINLTGPNARFEDYSFYGLLYVLTPEGFAYQVDNNGQNGASFNFFSNNKGAVSTPGDFNSAPSYQSVNTTTLTTLNNLIWNPFLEDNANNKTNKVFYNAPAWNDLPETAPVYIAGTSTSTWLYKAPTVPDATNIIITCEGDIAFTSNVDGRYNILIDANDNGSYDDAIDVRLAGTAVLGLNTVAWDGKDGLGNNIILTQVKMKVRTTVAEIHFPFLDVESNYRGIVIKKLDPLSHAIDHSKDTVFWNDRNITHTSGTSAQNANAMGGIAAPVFTNNGVSSTSNGHKWGSGAAPKIPGTDLNYFGNNKTLDTWTFTYDETERTIPFGNCIAISGSVWNDVNANITRDGGEPGISGTTNNGSGTVTTGTPVYVYLVNSSGIVIEKTQLGANGTYQFNAAPRATPGLKIILSSRNQSFGDTMSVSTTPAGWSNTGEIADASNTASQLVSGDGIINLETLASNITGQDFGIVRKTASVFTTNNAGQCLSANSFVFTNSSTGSGTLTYAWYFGDGSTSATKNPAYTYTAAGSYTVRLITTGGGGKDTAVQTVTVYPAPGNGFTINNDTQYLTGNSFTFVATDSASGNSYAWNFGDSNTGSGRNPSHAYSSVGNYTVKLMVTNGNGCKDSSTQVVKVVADATDARFTIDNDEQCLDGNSFVFTNASTGGTLFTYIWNFDDGNTATTENATHTYTAAGTYSVKLIVTGAGGADSVSKTVIVDAPQAGFSVNDTVQHLTGNSFEFTSEHTAHSYHWIFGDGNTSNAANPVHSYTAPGIYQVKQIVYTPKGCMAYAYKTVKVIADNTDVSFTVNNDKQCFGNPFAFTSTVTGTGPFVYGWTFGDGNTSVAENPVYYYATPGSYTVQLIVTGAGGADTATLPVTVYAAPVAGFTVNEETQEQTGNSFVFTSTATGAHTYHWDFGDLTTSTDEHPVKSYDSAGTHEVVQIVTATSGCADTAKISVVVISDSVTSGNDGGIESESMGGLVTKRDFNRIKNSVAARVNYAQTAMFMPEVYNAVAKGTKRGLELVDMIPVQLESGDVMFVTSPTDLLSITSAVDVLSVDYTRDHKAKAVALGIKTLDRAYSHTKSICDRFRGAELMFVEDVKIQGYDFTRFALKRDGGIVEYAIAFVAGKDKGRDNYTLQTNWLLSSYEPDEHMYNFQVWSANPEHAVKLAGDVLDNLRKEQDVKQINEMVLPKSYITYGYRDKENLIVRINNLTSSTSGRLVFEERINEDAGLSMMEIPLTLVPGKNNEFVIPIRDGYEYQGSLYLDGVLEDEVYLADGNWGIDYDNNYTAIERFERGNNKERIYQDGEYPVYRNVTLQAKSRDYVSVYKAIRSGTEQADLTAYKSLRFYAQGNGQVEVRLTRDSIVDWRSQYKTVVNLTEKGKEYTISFDDFLSDNIDAPFHPKDVKTIVFTYNTGGGKSQEITLHVSDVSFSKEAVTATRGLDSRVLSIVPNPNEGKFECRFASEKDRILNMSITDVTGKVVFSKSVAAAMGVNVIPVDLNLPSGMILFISLKGDDDLFYDVQKMVTR